MGGRVREVIYFNYLFVFGLINRIIMVVLLLLNILLRKRDLRE